MGKKDITGGKPYTSFSKFMKQSKKTGLSQTMGNTQETMAELVSRNKGIPSVNHYNLGNSASYSLGSALYKPIKDPSIERAKKNMHKTSKNSRNIRSIYSNKAVPIKANNSFSHTGQQHKQKQLAKKNFKFSMQKGIYQPSHKLSTHKRGHSGSQKRTKLEDSKSPQPKSKAKTRQYVSYSFTTSTGNTLISQPQKENKRKKYAEPQRKHL